MFRVFQKFPMTKPAVDGPIKSKLNTALSRADGCWVKMTPAKGMGHIIPKQLSNWTGGRREIVGIDVTQVQLLMP
jgi:hypothetical protein